MYYALTGGEEKKECGGDSVLIFITGSFAWWMRHNVFLGCSGNKVSHAFVPRSASSPWQAGGIMIGNARGPRVRPPTRYPTSFLPLLPFILSALSRQRERERERDFSLPFSILRPSPSTPSSPRPLFLYRVFFPTTILRIPFCRYAFLFRWFLLLLSVSSSCNENSTCSLRFWIFQKSCFTYFLIRKRSSKRIHIFKQNIQLDSFLKQVNFFFLLDKL